jgi:hypothetical protein
MSMIRAPVWCRGSAIGRAVSVEQRCDLARAKLQLGAEENGGCCRDHRRRE